MRRIRKYALVDSGFWFALFNERDTNHHAATRKSGILKALFYIIPWPTLYETLNTRFMRRAEAFHGFVSVFLKSPGAVILDDVPYRESALEKTLGGRTRRRHLSLVDNVVREMISDRNLKLHCLFTFNPGDFHDVCSRRNLEIL